MSPAAPAQPAVTAVQTVRIRLGKLDALIKLMGEVVSGHARLRLRLNDLGTLERTGQGEGLSASALRQLGKALREDAQAQMLLMEELRERTLEMRMLPLSVVFDPIGRTVREMARSLGKQTECVVTGAEIELDRQIIERLSEPVVHLLRNAVDHGIATPERREALGTPPMGRGTVSARSVTMGRVSTPTGSWTKPYGRDSWAARRPAGCPVRRSWISSFNPVFPRVPS
jgi:chemotaxis protein histidine kinase CheA